MQFSENWLRTFVNPQLSSAELNHSLTMAGLEVEHEQSAGVAFTKVIVGEIMEVVKHPDADRLQLCRVNIAKDKTKSEILQIVCGAANARVGIKVPCALVGAQLPGISIKQAQVRGVDSFGMLCSAKELGLADNATGLLELPFDAPIGADIRDYLDLNDHLFTLKLTPNRADCLSILGVARDVAAITGAPLLKSYVATHVGSHDTNIDIKQDVKVVAVLACPAYYGCVIESVNALAKTPEYIVRNLERSGVRSISAIVDITNYVLLELGQPLHAFDLSKINGAISVRYAHINEEIKLLNESVVKLNNDDLVIADLSGPIACAGIMGGISTSVSNTTTSIFLEGAFFTPDAIAGKARRLGLSTDSSYRFERGVDFGNTKQALMRAIALIIEICGGVAGEIIEIVNRLPIRNTIELRYARLLTVLGIHISQAEVAKLLLQLRFDFVKNEQGFSVTAPTYRFDIAREEDLIEEIARLHGFDKIEAIAPVASFKMLPSAQAQINSQWIQHTLLALSYQEVITYSFVNEAWERNLMGNNHPIKLKNPIASHMSVMRSGLWGGLLDALTYNLNRKQDRVVIFELGSNYLVQESIFSEKSFVAGLFYGSFLPEQWGQAGREVDFYDIKAHVAMLTNEQAQYRAETHPALHPGQSARVYLRNKNLAWEAVGWIGKLHPKWQQHYNLTKNTFLFELETKPLLTRLLTKYQEVTKFLPVRRDLAIVVDANLTLQAIEQVIETAKISLLLQIQLFDVYQGKGMAENKKSLALSVLIQDTHKTLLDKDVDNVMSELLKLLQKNFGAELRN